MKIKKTIIFIASLFLFSPLPRTQADTAIPTIPVHMLDQGKLLFESRLRLEHANTEGARAANAFTLRTRLGYETGTWNGFSGVLEFSNLEAIGNRDNYNAAGTNPGAANRTVVPDVPGTEVNRAALTFRQTPFSVTAGRQRVILDNARFIGNVGWRQREQTFDALTVRVNNDEPFSFFYSYIGQVNRIFGPDHPGGRWESDSHVLNVSYAGFPFGTVAAYGYFLRFPDAQAASSDTTGLYWTGDYPWDDNWTFRGHLEYAQQVENRESPAGSEFKAHYFRAEGSATLLRTTFGAGWELLGSDGGNYGFSTPLATLHAFNGWTDVFLSTPNEGLRDFYIFARQAFPANINGRVGIHDFRPDSGGGRFGNEFNILITKQWTSNWSTLLKLAHFEGSGDNVDVTKGWLQTEFRY